MVDCRQRCALSAGQNIGIAEFADNFNLESVGQFLPVADLVKNVFCRPVADDMSAEPDE